MATERWAYQVIEIKSAFFGFKTEAIQGKLDQMGQSGWELVQVMSAQSYSNVHLYFKRPL